MGILYEIGFARLLLTSLDILYYMITSVIELVSGVTWWGC